MSAARETGRLETPPPSPQRDLRWMRHALALAERARGRTAPNPLVGAVLVDGDRVVGEGWHERAGAPHAETRALEQAGEAARGATLYVTLEPCAHQGRTPPCAPAVVAAGAARVVTALEDPDPRVRGAGHELLRQAGVAVEVGVAEDEARRTNAEYLHRVATGRVFGVLKAAVTLDGRLAAEGGDSKWITGEPARERAHRLRGAHDAVLVGRGTLERDDPRLDVRLSDRRSPVAVVVDSHLRSPLERSLWNRSKEGAEVIVATLDDAPAVEVAKREELGLRILRTAPGPDGRVDLEDLFRQLAGRGMNSVLIEGGETLHTAVLASGLAQRAHVFVAPTILGGAAGPRLVGDLGIRRVADAIRLEDVEVEMLGRDVLLTGRIPGRDS